MFSYPDKDPNTITHWVLGSRGAEDDEHLDAKRAVPRAATSAWGPAKHPVSARFRTDHQQYRRANETYHNGPHFNRLVIDDNTDHTGRALCESPTSLGPDFLNTADGTFCRMSDKTLWPVCDQSQGVSDNCFNRDSKQLMLNGVAARDSPYENVIDWTATP